MFMKHFPGGARIAIVAAACLPLAAHAETLRATFSGTFAPGAPQGVVSGSITFESLSSPPNAVTVLAVDLTIGGHAYTVQEVSGYYLGFTRLTFGATVNGVPITNAQVFDFQVDASPYLAYTVPTSSTIWTATVSSFSVSTVPEPATALMAAAGIVAVLMRIRRPTRS